MSQEPDSLTASQMLLPLPPAGHRRDRAQAKVGGFADLFNPQEGDPCHRPDLCWGVGHLSDVGSYVRELMADSELGELLGARRWAG